jgi:hypothetical protein
MILYPRYGSLSFANFDRAPDKPGLLDLLCKNNEIIIVDEGAHAVYPGLHDGLEEIRITGGVIDDGLYINAYSVPFRQPGPGEFIYKQSAKTIFDAVNANNWWLRYADTGEIVSAWSGTGVYDLRIEDCRVVVADAMIAAMAKTNAKFLMLDEHHDSIRFLLRPSQLPPDSEWGLATTILERKVSRGGFKLMPNGNKKMSFWHTGRYMQNVISPQKSIINTINSAMDYATMIAWERDRKVVLQSANMLHTSTVMAMSAMVDGYAQISEPLFGSHENPKILPPGALGRPVEYEGKNEPDMYPVVTVQGNWMYRDFTNGRLWLEITTGNVKVDWK